MAKLPGLTKVFCRRNPLMSSAGNARTAEQLLIAKLGQLVCLNGLEVS